ncbi:rhomboid family protein [Labrys monachus]|uniref:Membrane associated rhomboid family serine protease n=1 Tax=Labrys monachus TaxID=217067 RepID=A0ABU0FP55_9HYPH|nr:rhomboid family intramembrane serine protease [Labrys monachus]MDQ0396321.1 membrane associated rhomboid family serine protease [Labrys monachus]
MSRTTRAGPEGQPAGRPKALWRRALLGPMPLSHPLIAACIAYYALGCVLSIAISDGSPQAVLTYLWSPSQFVLIDMGIGGSASFAQGEVWTLVTALFLHANLLHIGVNMLCLYMIMPMVEASFGRLRAFILYILAGMLGAAASVLWGETYSLGASGAIFGLFGGMLAYGALRGDAIGRRIMIDSAKWAALNFAFGLLAPVAVSNAAHFGGFIGGAAVALAMIYPVGILRRLEPRRLGFALASIALVCLAAGSGTAVSSTFQAVFDPAAYFAQRSDELIAHYSAVLAQNPGNGEARAMRGMAFAQKDDDEDAIADFNAAIIAGMDTPGLQNNLAWSLFKVGRNREALGHAESAVKSAPDTAAFLDTRAHIYEALGERAKAVADYEAALRQDPSIQESKDGLARLTGSD